MTSPFFVPFKKSSFHIVNDLAPLMHMIKKLSLKLSEKARQRLQWMDSYRECNNASQVCRHFSVPLRTFWYWRNRYDPYDLKSLEDKSRKPKSSPNKTPREIELVVLALKRKHSRWGKEKIALYLRKKGVLISGKTCWKIFNRHRLIIKYRTTKRKPPKPRANWAEIRLPGDLLEMDVKHIHFNRRRLYQYTIIDVVSRWRYASIYYKCDMKTTIAFFETASKKAPFLTKMIQTDNGPEFRTVVTAYLKRKNIKHVFTHKHRPVENGHVERSHRTDQEEFYSIENMGNTTNELRERFAEYLKMYNYERPHWGLGGKTPVEALATYSLKKPCKMS